MAPLSPSEIARRQKDIRLRSTLKDSQLTPELLRKRLVARRMKRPILPGSSQTYGDMLSERKAASELRYGQSERSLQAQQPRDAGWYDAYLQAVREAQARQQGQQAQTAAQIQQFGQAGLNASQQAQAQLDSQMQALVAPTGAAVDPSVANVGQQASLVRQALVNSVGATASANAQAQGDLLRTRESAGGLAKLEHLDDLSKQLAALQREKGAYEVDFEAQFKDDARRAVLEDQAFGLKQDQEAFDQADALADNARADAENASKLNKYGYTSSEWTALSEAERDRIRRRGGSGGSGSSGGIKWGTPAAQGEAQRSVESAMTYARQLRKYGRANAARWLVTGQPAQPLYDEIVDPKTGKTTQQRRLDSAGRAMSSPAIPAFDPVLASVALDMVFDGHISRNNLKRLHERGIKVKALGLTTKAPPARIPGSRP